MNEDEDTRLTLAKSQSENGELQLAGLLGIVRKSVMTRGEPPDSGPTLLPCPGSHYQEFYSRVIG